MGVSTLLNESVPLFYLLSMRPVHRCRSLTQQRSVFAVASVLVGLYTVVTIGPFAPNGLLQVKS